MSAQTEPALAPGSAGAPAGAPRWGGLLRAEVLRARSRRSLWWMTGLTIGLLLVIAAMAFSRTGAATTDDLDAAVDRFMAEQQRWYDECMSDPGIPEAERESACWKPSLEDARANAFWYLDPAPFTADDKSAFVLVAGGLAAVVALMVGASAGGADWGARTMGLVLSWEPRRLRVFAARLAVLMGVALLTSAVIIGLGWAAATFIASMHGLDPGLQASFGSMLGTTDPNEATELALRWVPLGVLAAAGGYGVAMAARSTGWAIGVTVALLAIVGPILQGVWHWGAQWLIHTNLQAWLEGGAYHIIDARRAYTQNGELDPGSDAVVWISQGRAMLTLVLTLTAILVVAATLLRRRDVD